MFKKVLIANRGEIAVRILRACHEMGISVVAVYPESDRGALHVRYADEAYFLGPGASEETYLARDKILGIAKKAGVDAMKMEMPITSPIQGKVQDVLVKEGQILEEGDRLVTLRPLLKD